MEIENRTAKFNLGNITLNTDFRAAVHEKFSSQTSKENSLKMMKVALREDFSIPLDSETSLKLHGIHDLLIRHMPKDSEFIFLSSLGPFGLDSTLADTSPLKVAHTTGRTADVVADPTTQMAFETYRRRIKGDRSAVSMCTFHRCTRLQRYSIPNYKTTFDMFGTIDSASGQSGNRFVNNAIASLINYYTNIMTMLAPNTPLEVCLGNIKVAGKMLANNTQGKSTSKEQLLKRALPEELSGRVPIDLLESDILTSFSQEKQLTDEVAVIKDLAKSLKRDQNIRYTFQLSRASGVGHYSGSVFSILTSDGIDYVDGGEVSWISDIASNSKEKTVVSGFGTELLARTITRIE